MTGDRWQVKGDMWHAKCDTIHMTHDMGHMTHDMWHLTTHGKFNFFFYTTGSFCPAILPKKKVKYDKKKLIYNKTLYLTFRITIIIIFY